MVMAEPLSKMSHLRLLILKKVTFSGNLSCLSGELRYLEWNNYPYKYMPSSFQPNQLVELILKHSSIKKLWKDKKYLPNLRALDMSYSKNLRKMPDFGEIPNLEWLKLEGCEKLVQMDPSIGVLRNLVVLNFKDCKNLASIPDNIFGMSSLIDLNLSGCPKVLKNPRQLKKLDSSESIAHSQSSTSSIFKWTALHFHSLYPKDLASCFLRSLLSLSCLRELDISFCGLSELSDAIGCLHWLEELNLGGNNFVTLPSLKELSKLVYLNLEHCKKLESLPQLPFPTAIKHDLQINTHVKKKKGLIIFNCPKLGEREHCGSIMFSWMIQFIQANLQSSTLSFDEIIRIVIPKTEIPIWSNNQRMGDSIRLDPSPMIMHDNVDHLIGIACCALFSVAPIDPTLETDAQRPEIWLSFFNSKINVVFTDNNPVILERDLIAVKSNHMWLSCIPLELFIDIIKGIDINLDHLNDFLMKICTSQVKGLDLEVQNCGYYWLYKQDHTSQQKFLSSEVQVNEAQPQPFI